MTQADAPRFVRRDPVLPLFRLGERPEPLVQPLLGARFPAYPVKERDFLLDLPQRRRE